MSEGKFKANAQLIAKAQKRQNRLNSIKNQLESGSMTNFDQMFAIISETRIASELGISFYTFRKKWKDPGEFSINEMMRFAALIGVKYDMIRDFIWNMIKNKRKSRIFRDSVF
jgi:hypothetical protein